MINYIKMVEQEQLRTDLPNIAIGDYVRVHLKVREGTRERIQVFEGTIIARKSGGLKETITVRRLSYGVGVERVLPLHSPRISRIEIVRRGKIRRAKLYYLRDRVGKAARVKERLELRDSKKSLAAAAAAAEAAAAAAQAAAETEAAAQAVAADELAAEEAASNVASAEADVAAELDDIMTEVEADVADGESAAGDAEADEAADAQADADTDTGTAAAETAAALDDITEA